ncbi:hypothetical protein, partial [Rhodosalinus sp.]|uniref:hypothetical protein n=1 Tax=Rhodosalinus sp. TaxID=2047741 RepID=UPI00397BD584
SDVLKRFQLMRSNNVRLTPMMPSFGRDGEAEVQRLFEELVGVAPRQPRRTKVSIRLKRELKRLDVLKMFDQNPESISLPRYSLILRPDLGIRREVYNVISAARFDDPERGIEQAGKHALEGRAVHKNLGMKLVVVGDFGEQPVDYFEAIREDLQQANTALYRMDNLEKLAQDYLLH